MREITTHHDGFGLNDSIKIVASVEDDGAAHRYELTSAEGGYFYTIQFQRGPRHEEGSWPGLTADAVMAVLLDYLKGAYGRHPSSETSAMIMHIEEASLWSHARARRRAARGVLGKDQA